MKVVLLESKGSFFKPGKYCRYCSLEPIGLEYIASQAVTEGFDVTLLGAKDFTIRDILDIITNVRPDVVGMQVYTFSERASRLLARSIKTVLPNVKIVVGGPHPSGDPSIALDPYIDFAIIGEGDIVFKDFLVYLANGWDTKNLKGLAFKKNGSLFVNGNEPISDINTLAYPYRDGGILSQCKIFGMAYPPPSRQRCVAQVITSRGCSFRCSFCLSPKIFGNKLRFRTPGLVVDEIKCLVNTFGTNMIFFSDLTFNSSTSHTISLCSAFKKSNLEVSWYAMCRADNLTPEIIRNMHEAGCTKIGIGIDGLSDNSITLAKQKGVKIKTLQRVAEMINNFGIITRGYIIIGYPWETLKDLKEAKEIIKTFPLDDLRITFATPFPGTQMANLYEKCITNFDFTEYTTEYPIFALNGLNLSEASAFRQEIYEEYYLCDFYRKRMEKKIRKFTHLSKSYEEFVVFLSTKDICVESLQNHACFRV